MLLKSLPGKKFVAKVSDFGSANLAKYAKTAAEGAIIYSAPESFPPSMDPDAKSSPKQTVKMDTYSYGVLLCEVINQELPDPENRNAMVTALATKWIRMHTLVLRCIKHDATQRPTMVEILNYLRNNK